MMLAMVDDIRVILVKLADRTHNMRTLWVMPPDKRRRIAKETLDIYAPIALRLGMNKIKLELEDLGFRALYPYRYRVLEKMLKRGRSQKRVLEKIKSQFDKNLKRVEIPGRVSVPGEAPLQRLSEDALQAAAAERNRRCFWHSRGRDLG